MGQGSGRIRLPWAVGFLMLGVSLLTARPWRAESRQSDRIPSAAPFRAAAASRPSRQTKSIEAIRPGDRVLARDDLTGSIEAKAVRAVRGRTSDHLRVLSIRGVNRRFAEEIRTTDNHPFWVIGKGWVEAGRLTRGEHLEGPEGAASVVDATRREAHPGGIRVYNIEVEGYHSYFVGRSAESGLVWVHNDCLHHMLPQQLKTWFRSRGVGNIHDFTVPLPKNFHTDLHRPNMGNWNGEWIKFRTDYSTATPPEIMNRDVE